MLSLRSQFVTSSGDLPADRTWSGKQDLKVNKSILFFLMASIITTSGSTGFIASKIQFLKGEKVLFDFDLAILYGVERRVLNQAVRRNLRRFPKDFMLKLSMSEWSVLRSQFVILEKGRGKFSKYPPDIGGRIHLRCNENATLEEALQEEDLCCVIGFWPKVVDVLSRHFMRRKGHFPSIDYIESSKTDTQPKNSMPNFNQKWPTCLLLIAATFIPVISMSQDLRPGFSLTPLPFFNDYEEGFVVLRDGTQIDGLINLKDYEKSGERIVMKAKDGKKYSLSVYSMKYFGLNIMVPRNMSPLYFYDWKTEKRKETREPERGFAVLASGETLDGKIHIEGRSSDSPWAAGNYFAIETLSFMDKSGKITPYTRDQVKSFGRILPWELSPKEMWQWQAGVAFGKRKSKFQPGFLIMSDGKRVEGEMQLVVKNKMSRSTGDGMDRQAVKPKTYSELVDEIYFKRDGKDEKISLDDVFAYGAANMTINTLTNKGARLYQNEEMNFHDGSVTTKAGKKLEGFVAYRPYASNYYGIYYAAKPDDPITIIPRDEIQEVVQNISLLEAFDDGTGTGTAPKSNTNINGYVIQPDGAKFEGTVKLVEDNDWWVKSIEFTDKDGNVLKYGDTHPSISCFAFNGTVYVQSENVFVKTEMTPGPFTMYLNPYPPKGSFGSMLLTEVASAAVGMAAGSAMEDAQMSGLDLSGVSVDGVDLGKGTTPNFNPMGIRTLDGQEIQQTQAYNVIGASASDLTIKGLDRLIDGGKNRVPEKGKKPTYYIFNLETKENGYLDISQLLEGCIAYWSATKDERKLLEDKKIALEYLNKCYSKNKK